MKNTISFTLFLILGITFTACAENEEDLTIGGTEEEGELTRVNVEEMNEKGIFEDDMIFIDEKKLEMIQKSLANVEWEPNVEAEISRENDALLTLFYTLDENEPEEIYKYQIWFSDNKKATIISSKKSEGFGKVNEENTQFLKNAIKN